VKNNKKYVLATKPPILLVEQKKAQAAIKRRKGCGPWNIMGLALLL
jgi:hypothetical protein